MIKLVGLLKRKPGITTEQFRSYYENTHRLIGLSVVRHANSYSRRYVSNLPGSQDNAPDIDVITEIGYDSLSHLKQSLDYMSRPDVRKIISDDEINLFDQSAMTFYVIDEEFSDNMVHLDTM